MDEKLRRFQKLWRGETPRGISMIKRQRFRSLMKCKLMVRGLPLTEENARMLWMGELKKSSKGIESYLPGEKLPRRR
jgi:hypothetical protein